jgi:hypothetical protein
MPAKLTTKVSKIAQVPNNKTNSAIIQEFHAYMKARGSSEQHHNNNLKVVIAYANFLGPETTFFDIQQKSQITTFRDKKVKPPSINEQNQLFIGKEQSGRHMNVLKMYDSNQQSNCWF